MAEPFLNEHFIDMIEYAGKRGHNLFIFTTLIGLKEQFIPRLEKIPISNFEIHLPDNESKTNIIVNKNYLSILKKIKIFKSLGIFMKM
jgi:MoaA/NifB/PqqE/SkfB family radical SAM enzyme